jgi:hypothetical protein
MSSTIDEMLRSPVLRDSISRCKCLLIALPMVKKSSEGSADGL